MAKSLFASLKQLYGDMEGAYADHARLAGLSCEGCTTNCCSSFFQHHTHVEWIYLLKGIQALPAARQQVIAGRAREYAVLAKQRLSSNQIPDIMCPLNEQGLCTVYAHRLMICRMHGTKNCLRLPNGQEQIFRGCNRFTSLPDTGDMPYLDRTPFYQRLASLEVELLRKAGRPLPGVKLTIAEMILLGPPKIR